MAVIPHVRTIIPVGQLKFRQNAEKGKMVQHPIVLLNCAIPCRMLYFKRLFKQRTIVAIYLQYKFIALALVLYAARRTYVFWVDYLYISDCVLSSRGNDCSNQLAL